MRIVAFGKYYHPVTGGTEAVTRHIAQGAANRGAESAVVAFCPPDDAVTENDGAVEIIRCPARWVIRSQPLSLVYFVQCLRHGHRADIVHVHAPNLVAAAAAVLLPRRVKVLVHWHLDIVNKGMLGIIAAPLQRWLLRRASGIAVTSPPYAEFSAALRPFRDKLFIAPLGCADIAANPAPPGALDGDLEDFIANRRVILAIGRHVPYKGFDVLIRAARNLPADTCIVIVGDGPLRQQLQHLIAQEHVADQVLLAGRRDDDTRDRLYRLAALFCMSSKLRSEAFGLVMVEAMTYGLPIVATTLQGSGVPWVNAHGVSGINVPPNDPAALSAAFADLMSDPQRLASLARGARNRFETAFTEDLAFERIWREYRRMAGLTSSDGT